MRSLLLLLGILACARASFIDLNNINTQTDALTYVLNLKCLREYFFLSLRLHHCRRLHRIAASASCVGFRFLSAYPSE